MCLLYGWINKVIIVCHLVMIQADLHVQRGNLGICEAFQVHILV